MKIRFAEPTPPAKPDVPFVVGGTYRHKSFADMVVVLVRAIDDGPDRYRFYTPSEGKVGCSGSEEAIQRILTGYVYCSDAELVIPRPADAK